MVSFERSKRMWIFLIFCSAALALQPIYADPGRGTLYGTDGSGGDTITVDPGTGVGTSLGSTGVDAAPSLAVDPTTGIIYGGEGSGEPNLYTVDPIYGDWTLVGADLGCGNTGLGFAAIGGMDFRADGTLFAAVNIAGDGGTGSDHLAILDKTTGLASVIGPFGTCSEVETECTSGTGSCTIEGMEAIAFDASGVLWGTVNARGAAGSPGLYKIDPTTGAATFETSILETEESIPDGGIVSLQFECDGTLLGGTSRSFSETDGGRLGTIDTITGDFTAVGSVSATGGSSLAALGYDTPCPQRPVCTGTPITDPAVGVAGTTTDDDGIATIELDESSTNLVLDVDEFEEGASTVLFTVEPDISGFDAEGSVIVTDVTGLTCQLPVNFTAIPAGPTVDEVVCSGEGILLEVSNPLSTAGGGVICSGSEFTDGEPALPPGVDPSPDGDPTLCRVLTITSPISGETIMVYKKDGTFEPRLRLFISELEGTEFSDFRDVTESVIEIADIIPDPTRLQGRGRWSTVKVTCAILHEVCNGLDDDGDTLVDEDLPVGDPTVDEDEDGFPLCPAAGETGDCSDTNPDIHPGRIEDCDNGLDDNCDGLVDEADPQCDFLLVELSSFTGSGGPAGVLLEWKTISEVDNEGFRVLRARGDGEPVLLTPDLIPARGGMFQTTHYEYLDPEWQRPGTVHYYLEDVDSNGTITRHGPVEIRIRRPVGVKPKGRPEGR